MSENLKYKNLKPLIQSILIILLFFLMAQLVLGSILTNYDITDLSSLTENDVVEINILKFAHFISSLLSFVFPAVLIAGIIYRNVSERLMFSKKPNVSWYVLASLILIFAMPFMNLIIQWNEAIVFPESLSDLYKSFRASEDSAIHITELMLAKNTSYNLWINIVVMALIPALGEEMLFRGIIQRLFHDLSKNIHVAIWLSAFLFSAIHFQFFGFIPRLLLGAFFGYLVYFSGSILLGIWVHFLNNGLAILAHHFMQKGDLPENVDKLGSESGDLAWVMISIALTIFLFSLLVRKYKRELSN
ncbi:MAG: CPBP family intramembrane metalloprotease [Bacteroidales bacterium]|nr:CPBP family intramembrane metalloprotease [Bacteroidales bacterium]